MRSLRSTIFAFIVAAFIFATCATAQTSVITTFAGTPANGPGFAGDAGPAASAQLFAPTGVAVDTFGNVYIADYGNGRVRVVNATTSVISTYVSGLMTPTGVAVDLAGNLYVADGEASKVYIVSNGVATTLAGTGTPTYSGDGGAAAAAGLNYPSGVAVDASGNVYIADTGNNRIRKVSAGIITTLAGNSALGYNGDNISATVATLFAPQGVAVDSSGNVYIADTQNQRIRKVSSGIITTFAGTGTAGYTGDQGAATAATINRPRGVSVDLSGNVYIADFSNNVIREVSSGNITTIAGNGSPGFSGDGGPATSAQLNQPLGVAIFPTLNVIYIADSQNNAVRAISAPVTSTAVIPQFAAGQAYVTGLYVINKSSSAAPFTISFYNDQGAAVTVPVSGGSSTATTSGNSFTDTIPALGLGYYEAGVLGSATQLSGSAIIQAAPSVAVQALFRHQGAAATPYEAAVASTTGSFEAEFPFDDTIYTPTSEQISTGIAIVNIDAVNTANITCVARNSAGNIIAGAVAPPALNPKGHWASYQFPALANQRGTLDCTSNTKIGVTALRFIGIDAVSTLPVILK